MLNSNIIVGGFVPFTTIDYPGSISSVIFLKGCPWRCVYCSNPHLFEFKKASSEDKSNWSYIIETLKKRTNHIDAVVFSGGEATAQSNELITAINDIHEFAPHFKIGLHTNGCFPEHLKNLAPHIDWFGFDIKAPIEKYDAITKVKGSGALAHESLKILLELNANIEVRTTCDPSVLEIEDIKKIANHISDLGATTYAIQRYRPVDKDNANNPPQNEITKFFTNQELKEYLNSKFKKMDFRF